FDQRFDTGCRQVIGAKAERRVTVVDAIVHIVRSPPRNILKQSNAADGAVGAQVEPMPRSGGNIDQIARLDLNGEHRAVLRMNVEDAATFNGEADFVFTVGVLLAEFGQHGVQVGRLRVDVDDVCRHKPTQLLEAFDLGGVGGQDFFVAGVGADAA